MPNSTTIPHDIPTLKRLFRQLAILNIVLCEEDWLRYHRYYPQWDEGVDSAKIDNGSGDTLWALFYQGDAVLKGFDHESPVSPYAQAKFKSWPNLYTGLPPHLEQLLEDKALLKDEVTFCLWRTKTDAVWQQGPVVFPNGEDDGTAFLLQQIYANSQDFKAWADEYFDLDLPEALLSKVYDDAPLTDELILGLNPSGNLAAIKADLKALG